MADYTEDAILSLSFAEMKEIARQYAEFTSCGRDVPATLDCPATTTLIV